MQSEKDFWKYRSSNDCSYQSKGISLRLILFHLQLTTCPDLLEVSLRRLRERGTLPKLVENVEQPSFKPHIYNGVKNESAKPHLWNRYAHLHYYRLDTNT
jgi:hypothetical protein